MLVSECTLLSLFFPLHSGVMCLPNRTLQITSAEANRQLPTAMGRSSMWHSHLLFGLFLTPPPKVEDLPKANVHFTNYQESDIQKDLPMAAGLSLKHSLHLSSLLGAAFCPQPQENEASEKATTSCPNDSSRTTRFVPGINSTLKSCKVFHYQAYISFLS